MESSKMDGHAREINKVKFHLASRQKKKKMNNF